MDIISVTDASLRNCYIILQQMSDISDGVTAKCKESLLSELGGLNTEFRKDVQKFIEAIDQLREKLKYCVDENMNAISDRLNRLPYYESQTYRKRIIV